MYKEEEIPFIKMRRSVIAVLVIKMILKDKGAMTWMYGRLIEKGFNEDVVIEVQNINGPVLLVSSGKDAIWPSKKHCEKTSELLEKADFKYECRHITYENSGHMLTVPYQAIYPSDKYPEDIDSYAKANISCWKETMEFLDKWKI